MNKIKYLKYLFLVKKISFSVNHIKKTKYLIKKKT